MERTASGLAEPGTKHSMWDRMPYGLKRVLTRPRALARSAKAIGVGSTLALVRIRFGSADRVYKVRVPQWSQTVYVRGGASTDTMVLYELLATNEYGIVDGLRSPKFIVDGGANIGLAGLYFLQRFPTAHIISVEPFPETFEVCKKNLEAHSGRTTTLNAAIWPHAGRVNLEPQGQDWANQVSEAGPGSEKSGAEAITMKSLVSRCQGSIDLLKLDVEGSEYDIFEPSSAEWLPFVRNIVIELHNPACVDRFFEALAPYDYEMSNRDKVYFCRNLRLRGTPVPPVS